MPSVLWFDDKVSWYFIPVRVLLITFVVTLLSFAVSLFLAIGGTLIAAAVRGVNPNMTLAYRHIAVPIAVAVAAVTVVGAAVMEIRRYFQLQMLHRLERQMDGARG